MVDIQNRELVEKQVEVQELNDRNELLERSIKKFVGQIDQLERLSAEQKNRIRKYEA